MKLSKHMCVLETDSVQGMLYPVILHDQNELIIVDTGFPLTIDSVVRHAFEFGYDLHKLTKILITHQDIDHIGCIKELKDLAPKAYVLAHEIEEPYIDGRKKPVKLAQFEQMDVIPPDMKDFYNQLKQAFMNRESEIDISLKDGDFLDICGGIEIVYTPGHTPGHICIYLHEDRVLIAGDALNVKNGKLMGPSPIYSSDYDLGVRSLAKLISKNIDMVVTYHGGVFIGNVEKALGDILSEKDAHI